MTLNLVKRFSGILLRLQLQTPNDASSALRNLLVKLMTMTPRANAKRSEMLNETVMHFIRKWAYFCQFLFGNVCTLWEV